MTPEPANPNDLRTALTKLADEHDAQTGPYARILHTAQIRALLAAHPAEVLSDTRREDVARKVRDLLRLADQVVPREILDEYRGLPDAVLAVLPAPPVVDEDVIAKVLAEFDSVPWANMRRETKDIYRGMAAAVAARLRGATRG